MLELSTKQAEIREREARIVESALPMVGQGGISAISMDAIAEQLGVTRGTVYNHFRNKEEIVLALAILAVEQRLEVFQYAVMMRGCPRQRLAAIGIGCEFYANAFPALLRVEYQIRHDLVWEKTSTERQELLQNCEGRCMHTVAGVVRDAVAEGELELSDSHSVEEIVFGLWSLVHGGMLLELTSPSLSDVGVRDARRAIRAGCNALLDGYRWHPLHDPAAYEKWIATVRKNFENFKPLTAAESMARRT